MCCVISAESIVSTPGRSRKASIQTQNLGYSGHATSTGGGGGGGGGAPGTGRGGTAGGRGSIVPDHVYLEDQTFDEEFKETSEGIRKKKRKNYQWHIPLLSCIASISCNHNGNRYIYLTI